MTYTNCAQMKNDFLTLNRYYFASLIKEYYSFVDTILNLLTLIKKSILRLQDTRMIKFKSTSSINYVSNLPSLNIPFIMYNACIAIFIAIITHQLIIHCLAQGFPIANVIKTYHKKKIK
jgi:hypothetical protein